MKSIIVILSALFLSQFALAQADTTSQKTTTKGDRNTEITTGSRTNVPRPARKSLPASRYRPTDPIGSDQPDVLLDVPHLYVDAINIEVDNLVAKLALDARVASLVQLSAGVDVSIDKVKIDIKGVEASALLVVRLDNVRAIIEKTLQTVNDNPQLVEQLLKIVDNTVNTVGGVANTALQPGGILSQTVNTLGQTVQKTLDATGNIVEKTLDASGKVVNTQAIGKVLDLPVTSTTTNTAGNTVKKLRDASGAVIEVVQDQAGKILSSRVISQGTSLAK